MLHVQSCAKKRLLTDETIRTLIQAELDIPTVPDNVPQQRTSKQPPGEPQTYFQDIVNAGESKRKLKRTQALQTIRNVNETRNEILERAKTFLHNKNPDVSHALINASKNEQLI